MIWKTHKPVASILMGLVSLSFPSLASAASLVRLSGEIAGFVTDSTGIPQMGARVMLFNSQSRLFQRALTDDRGEFVFAGLLPDIYTIRVNLASFVPAVKRQILVQPGTRSVLSVSMTGLFSSVQLLPAGSMDHPALMTDDWKWVLRAGTENRPVLRILPDNPPGDTVQTHRAVVSDTRGMLKLSAGDGGQALGFGSQADLGTAFALATSLFGNNQLQFSGNLGYGQSIPASAFRTSFSRNDAAFGSPEVSVTMRQLYIGRMGGASGTEMNMPVMRTMSLSFGEQTQLSDAMSFQYGFSLDSVSFLDRLNYFSPYMRLVYELGEDEQVDVAYTSGNARPDLASAPEGPDAELQQDLSSLSVFPRISMRSGRARVQRGENIELGYSRKVGTRTYRISGYREAVSNAALTLAAPEGLYSSADILPDLFSGNSIFNAGQFESLGYTLSMTQDMGDHLSATVMYGTIGGLTAIDRPIETQSPDELRSMIRAGRRHAVTIRTSGVLPLTGTHFIGSYQWADNRLSTIGHAYSTQMVRPTPGFNLYFRQPIPTFNILPWRMEATFDLRNLLAQGYLPLSMADGRRLLLVQTPRTFRGGLSFIF